MDIERYLRDEPVLARPPTALYRLQKVVLRNRMAFTAGAIVCLTLLLSVIVSTWQAVRAARAEREQSKLRAQAQQDRNEAVEPRKRAEQNAADSRRRL